jgi:hypothetical protein
MSENQGNLALMPVIPPIPEVPKEKVTALSLSGNDLLTAAKKQGKIASLEQFTAVNDEMVRIKDFKKQVEELFKDAKSKAHEAHKSICDAEKKLLNPLELAEKQYSPLILDYTREQDRIRREAEAEARRKAETEAEAERQTKLRAAETAMDMGASVAEIQSLIEEAEEIIPVYDSPITIQPVKLIGLVIKENWTYEITDIKQIPREYMMPNTVMLGQTAKALKGAAKIPGVRIYDAGTVAKAR